MDLYFDWVPDDAQNKNDDNKILYPLCKKCQKNIICRGPRNQNLRRHLEREHPTLYANCLRYHESRRGRPFA